MKIHLLTALFSTFYFCCFSQMFGDNTVLSEYSGAVDIHGYDRSGDGSLEILVATNDGEINYYDIPNNTKGAFQFGDDPILGFNEAYSVHSLFSSSSDKDAAVYSFVVSELGDDIGVINHNENSIFREDTYIPKIVVTSDLDNDGDMDVLAYVRRFSNHYIYWFQNNGNGEFSEAITINSLSDCQMHSLLAADIDQDGYQDILFTKCTTGQPFGFQLAWMKNEGFGNFSDVIGISSNFTWDVHAADLDGDGDKDIITMGNSQIRWIENIGNGSFSDETVLFTGSDPLYYPCDLDNDNDVDIIIVNGESTVSWLENIGYGSFYPYQNLHNVQGGNVSVIFPLDVDGDGDKDISWGTRTATLGSNSSGKLGWIENIGGGCQDSNANNYSPESLFATESCTYDKPSFKVFPNPMSESSILEMTNTNPKNISLLDSKGIVVRKWVNYLGENLQIDRRQLKSGEYIISVTEGSLLSTLKLIVN